MKDLMLKLTQNDSLEHNLSELMAIFPEIVKKENGIMGDYHSYYIIPDAITIGLLKPVCKYLQEKDISFEIFWEKINN